MIFKFKENLVPKYLLKKPMFISVSLKSHNKTIGKQNFKID